MICLIGKSGLLLRCLRFWLADRHETFCEAFLFLAIIVGLLVCSEPLWGLVLVVFDASKGGFTIHSGGMLNMSTIAGQCCSN